MATLYELLGVDTHARPQTLRNAYRRLARKHHPDINPDPKSHERMAEINAAFETLIDPIKRQEYDALITGASTTQSAPRHDPREHQAPATVSVRILHRLKQHKTPIYALSFAPDTAELVSASFDNELMWWDTTTGESTRRARLEGGVVSTLQALVEDRVIAAGCSESMVSTWALRGDKVEFWRNSPLEWVCAVGVSPNGQAIAMGSVYSALQVVRTDNGDALFAGTGHGQSITSVCWSHEGRYIATGSADASVKLWSGVTGKELHTFQNVRSTVTAMAFSPDGRMLAVAAVDRSIRLFRLADLTLDKVLFGHEKPIEAMAFHPNSLLLGSVSRDGVVGLWNAVQGSGHAKISASPQALNAIAFSPDGNRLAVGGLDKILRVWELTFKH
ncbi:MAG TPA: DnaJ domain-containing protein [Fimbriimonadaceae bacterium]|nr:DnaJ domain-containing protein [Fimbriimonadaceae bacterium]